MPIPKLENRLARFWARVDTDSWPGHALFLGARYYGEQSVTVRGRIYKGYGKVEVAGRVMRAQQLVWEQHHGPVPAGMAVDSGCGLPRCVRLAHLRLVEVPEALFRVAPGEAHWKAKLSPEKARQIRRLLAEGWGQQALAERFQVSPSRISAIHCNRAWPDEEAEAP